MESSVVSPRGSQYSQKTVYRQRRNLSRAVKTAGPTQSKVPGPKAYDLDQEVESHEDFMEVV
ncbi:hypothetical protein V1520DRAFT_30347 [Lipomyces starkeyi]